jgi:hypothetical protein
MDILNFIYWIRQRRVLKTLPKNSLIPVGVKDPRRDDRYLTCAIKASDLGLGEGGSTTGEYRMSQFADTIVPRTDFDESIVGKYFDNPGINLIFGSVIFVELENGNLANVVYNQSVLENGILIHEAYDIASTDPSGINGYWIAFQQDSTNPERLIKVGELQMTQQFWDNWYNWTAKDSGPNSVKLVATTGFGTENNFLESYITKLTWTGSALVAEDIYFDFGGETFGSLYTDLTGISPLSFNLSILVTEWILDDDYYGMAMGAEKGWCFYRNTNGSTNEESWITVGYNILTGETKQVNPMPMILALDNFSSLDPSRFNIYNWVNHPGGITYSFSNENPVDNGNNTNGITALWSPYWESNNECIYIGLRYQDVNTAALADRLVIGGDFIPQGNSSWYWDNKAFYYWTVSTGNFDQVYIMHKYHIETKSITSYTIPYLTALDNYTSLIDTVSLFSWANNDGMFINTSLGNQSASWGIEKYQYVKHEDSKIYKFHLDMYYPTHAFKDKIYNINTMATYNFDTLGVAISTYKKMKF